jgi:hypothetical protein
MNRFFDVRIARQLGTTDLHGSISAGPYDSLGSVNAEVTVQADDAYGPIVEEKLAELLPMLKQDNVKMAPVQSLRDPVATGIFVSIVGTVGPVLVREIFKTIREIVRDSYKDTPSKKKPARAVIRHKGKDHAIVSGDEDFGEY